MWGQLLRPDHPSRNRSETKVKSQNHKVQQSLALLHLNRYPPLVNHLQKLIKSRKRVTKTNTNTNTNTAKLPHQGSFRRGAVALREELVLPVCSSPPPSHHHYLHHDDTDTRINTNTNTNTAKTEIQILPSRKYTNTGPHLFVHLRPPVSHPHYPPPDDLYLYELLVMYCYSTYHSTCDDSPQIQIRVAYDALMVYSPHPGTNMRYISSQVLPISWLTTTSSSK